MTENKKAFDSTVCFTFYGSWMESIEQLETAADRDSPAYMLFKAVAEYSMYGEEPEFEGATACMLALRAIWPVIAREIENSMDRRRKGFALEGPNNKQQAILEYYRNHPNESYRHIGRAVRASKSSVGRTIRKYGATSVEVSSGGADVGSASVGAHDIYISSCTDNGFVHGSTGTGHEGQFDYQDYEEEESDIPF